MNRETLKSLLIAYGMRFPEECDTTQKFIEFIEQEPHCFDRSAHGHITASAWILDPTQTKVLLTHHKKFNKWMQLGGHADGNPNTAEVALTEGYEESGLQKITLLSPDIFDIDIHHIPGKCYAHYDVRYIFAAHDHTYIVSDESHDLAWVSLSHVVNYNDSISLRRLVAKTAPLLLTSPETLAHEETAS